MNKPKARSRLGYGVCAIIVSVFSTGCATVERQPLPAQDLAYFQIDCSRKQEQILFLQSLRSSRDDRLMAGLRNLVEPWSRYLDPRQHDQRVSVNKGYSDWLINQHLQRLAWDCP